MTLECAKQKLQQYGQEHLLKYFDTLSETQKEALLQQIEETDFSVLNKIGSNEEESSTGTITPIRALRPVSYTHLGSGAAGSKETA